MNKYAKLPDFGSPTVKDFDSLTKAQNPIILFVKAIDKHDTQIKSAIGNNGNFDGANPTITKSMPRILFFTKPTP